MAEGFPSRPRLCQVKTLSVTVDPGRDRPQVMREIGLTGTPDEIEKVAKQFGATYEATVDEIVQGIRLIL